MQRRVETQLGESLLDQFALIPLRRNNVNMVRRFIPLELTGGRGFASLSEWWSSRPTAAEIVDGDKAVEMKAVAKSNSRTPNLSSKKNADPKRHIYIEVLLLPKMPLSHLTLSSRFRSYLPLTNSALRGRILILGSGQPNYFSPGGLKYESPMCILYTMI